ncbi:tigger transposable element-derived protein 6-like [Ornithodoros turicata]|uniref:tigger transposable element-derived protein 6-like n=1 Tax=Ornithodoros turicata TaxID=34597 RepID=UPI003139CF5D
MAPGWLPPSASNVRKRKTLSMDAWKSRVEMLSRLVSRVVSRVEIINAVANGERKKDVAARYGIPANSLSTILKSKDSIFAAVASGTSTSRKRLKLATYEDVDKATFTWFMEMLAKGVPLTGAIVQRQAINFANMLGSDNFKASSGWLEKSKRRHAIVSRVLRGEAASADASGAASWLEEHLTTILEKYAPEHVYNADETALFYQMLPKRTLMLKGERCEGGKHSKQRFSVLLCVNMDGTDKRAPLVIGKSKKPHCFKGKRIPVKYTSNTKAWMSRVIFREWVTDFDRDMAKKGKHVCLLLDNCSAHHIEDVSLTHVEIRFLPPNCTSLIQPLDQGIINSMKCRYRARVVDKLLLDIRLERETKVNAIQALEMLAVVWQSVKREVVVNSFRKAGFYHRFSEENRGSDELEESEDAAPALVHQWQALREGGGVPLDIELHDFLTADSSAVCTEELRDEDIVAGLRGTADDGSDNGLAEDAGGGHVPF